MKKCNACNKIYKDEYFFCAMCVRPLVDMEHNPNGLLFEERCKHLLEEAGFYVQQTKQTHDGGIDLIASRKDRFLSGKYIVQCKNYCGTVGSAIVRDLYGVVTAERANKGILMTSGRFTDDAKSFAAGKPIELIDGLRFDDIVTTVELWSLEDVLRNFFLLESDYDEYLAIKNNVSLYNRTQDVSELIMRLITDITDCSAVVFEPNNNWRKSRVIHEFNNYTTRMKEVRNNIERYLSHPKLPGEMPLDLLYRMLYIQICIFEGNLAPAVGVFKSLLEYDDFDFTKAKNRVSNAQSIIYSYEVLFHALYATCYNMVQACVLFKDYPLLWTIQNNRQCKAIVEMKKENLYASMLDEKGFSPNVIAQRKTFFTDEIELLENCFNTTKVPNLRSVYRIDGEYIHKMHNHVYEGEQKWWVNSIFDELDIQIENNKCLLVLPTPNGDAPYLVEHTIPDIQSKVINYKLQK